MFFVETDEAEKQKKMEAARAARAAEDQRRPSFDRVSEDSSSDEEKEPKNPQFNENPNAGNINKGFVEI